MKITPVTSPHAMSHTQSTTNNSPSRDKAIQKLMEGSEPKAPTPSPALTQMAMGAQGAPSAEAAEALSAVANGLTDNTEETIPVVSEDTQASKDSASTDETPPKAEDPVLSKQFAQLAKQERMQRQKWQQQEQQFKAREEELKRREEALNPKPAPQQHSKHIDIERLKQDPLRVLTEAGLSYDDLTNQILNQGTTDPRVMSHIERLEAKIAEWETKDQSRQKSAEESQQAQYQAAVKQIEVEAKSLINNDPAYETIKAADAMNDVVELITETYNKDGILLSVEEAAQQVEEYLVEEAMKLAKLKKIQDRLKPAQASAAQSQTAQTSAVQKGQTQPVRTLTNAISTPKKMNARERAIAAFKGDNVG